MTNFEWENFDSIKKRKELEAKAEKILEELFNSNMSLKNFKGFKQDYRTLYNQVIIPAMLKFREDGNKRN